jgi:hypothetical protein
MSLPPGSRGEVGCPVERIEGGATCHTKQEACAYQAAQADTGRYCEEHQKAEAKRYNTRRDPIPTTLRAVMEQDTRSVSVGEPTVRDMQSRREADARRARPPQA